MKKRFFSVSNSLSYLTRYKDSNNETTRSPCVSPRCLKELSIAMPPAYMKLVSHDRSLMFNHSKSRGLICRQNNENLIENDKLNVGIAMNLVALDTSSKTNVSITFIVKIPTHASCCIVNCQFRGQLSDAMAIVNQTDRSLNGFKNIVK